MIVVVVVIIRLIDLVGRVFANGPRDLGSIPGHVIPKTLKMVLDTSLLNTWQYKIRIKGQVEQFRERSSTLTKKLLKREPSGRPRLRSPTLLTSSYNSSSSNSIVVVVIIIVVKKSCNVQV